MRKFRKASGDTHSTSERYRGVPKIPGTTDGYVVVEVAPGLSAFEEKFWQLLPAQPDKGVIYGVDKLAGDAVPAAYYFSKAHGWKKEAAEKWCIERGLVLNDETAWTRGVKKNSRGQGVVGKMRTEKAEFKRLDQLVQEMEDWMMERGWYTNVSIEDLRAQFPGVSDEMLERAVEEIMRGGFLLSERPGRIAARKERRSPEPTDPNDPENVFDESSPNYGMAPLELLKDDILTILHGAGKGMSLRTLQWLYSHYDPGDIEAALDLLVNEGRVNQDGGKYAFIRFEKQIVEDPAGHVPESSPELEEKIFEYLEDGKWHDYSDIVSMLRDIGIDDDSLLMDTLEYMEQMGLLDTRRSEDEKMWRLIKRLEHGIGIRSPKHVQTLGKSWRRNRIIKRVKFTKLDEKHRVVLGEVYTPAVRKGDEDCQDDWMDEEEITKMAYGFMERSRQVGKNHTQMLGGKAVIVESFIAGEGWEPFQKGAWVLGTKIKDDQLWKDIKSGKITGYSIGGDGIRVPAEIPVGTRVNKDKLGPDAPGTYPWLEDLILEIKQKLQGGEKEYVVATDDLYSTATEAGWTGDTGMLAMQFVVNLHQAGLDYTIDPGGIHIRLNEDPRNAHLWTGGYEPDTGKVGPFKRKVGKQFGHYQPRHFDLGTVGDEVARALQVSDEPMNLDQIIDAVIGRDNPDVTSLGRQNMGMQIANALWRLRDAGLVGETKMGGGLYWHYIGRQAAANPLGKQAEMPDREALERVMQFLRDNPAGPELYEIMRALGGGAHYRPLQWLVENGYATYETKIKDNFGNMGRFYTLTGKELPDGGPVEKEATLEAYGYEPEMIDGHEVYVFLDPSGQFIDKWTIIVDGAIFGMNDNPFHPQQGFSQFAGMVSEGAISSTYLESQEQKAWADLPEDVKEATRSRWRPGGGLSKAVPKEWWHLADQISRMLENAPNGQTAQELSDRLGNAWSVDEVMAALMAMEEEGAVTGSEGKGPNRRYWMQSGFRPPYKSPGERYADMMWM